MRTRKFSGSNIRQQLGGTKYFSWDPLWRKTRMRFSIQTSAAMSMMFIIYVISMLWHHAFGQTLCPPVSTGVRGSASLFYCKAAGCAADVTKVFCNDTLVHQGRLPQCSAPLLLHKACRLDGHAFVSSPKKCEFEGDGGHISTEKCTDTYPNDLWIPVSSPSPTTSNKEKEMDVSLVYIAVIGAVALVALVALGGGVALCVRMSRRGRPNQQPNRGPDVRQQVLELQPLGESTERDVEAAVPGADDALPQRGHGH